MTIRRIGILTYFWGINPGSVLQAYSSLTLLKSIVPDCDVEIINFQPPFKTNKKYVWNYFNASLTMHRLKILKLYQKYRSFCQNDLSVSDPLPYTKDYDDAVSLLQNKYDAIVVGSDTIWEIEALERKGLAPFPNIYWLSPNLNALKIAFSASMGATSIENIPDNILDKMGTLVAAFDQIGVRDDLTERAIKHVLLGRDELVTRTPDPTFSYQIRSTAVRKKFLSIGLDLNKPIAGICLPNIPIREKIISFLSYKGYQILLMNHIPEFYRGKGTHVFSLPALTPHEWAESFCLLKLSITQLFHGTIFSLKNCTPVISIDCQAHRYTRSGDSKTRSLLKEYGMNEYAHLNINAIKKDFSKLKNSVSETLCKFDKPLVEKTTSEMANHCTQFLKEAIVKRIQNDAAI